MPCNALPHNNQWPSTTRFSVTYIYSMRFSDAVCLYGKRNMQYRRQQPAGICENAFNGGPGKQNRWDTVIESRLPITICLDVTICGGTRGFLICNLFLMRFVELKSVSGRISVHVINEFLYTQSAMEFTIFYSDLQKYWFT